MKLLIRKSIIILLICLAQYAAASAQASEWRALFGRGADNHATKPVDNAKTVAPIRDKWAVLIGLTRFQDPGIAPLPYGPCSASDLAKVLMDSKVGRFAPNHVRVLTEAQATSQAVQDTLHEKWLLPRVLPDDLIVIYIRTRAVASADGKAVVLCFYDTQHSQPELTGVMLRDLLAEIRRRTQSKNIVCLLDLSPGDDRSTDYPSLFDKGCAGLPPARLDGTATGAQVGSLVDNANSGLSRLSRLTRVSIFSGNTLLLPSYDSAQKQSSFFAYSLSDALKTSDGMMPLAELSRTVRQNVQRDARAELNVEQNPELAIAPESAYVADSALGAPTRVDQAAPPVLKIGYEYDRLAIERPDLMPKGPSVSSPPGTMPDSFSGAPDAGVDEQALVDIDLHPYIHQAKAIIQSRWDPPKGLEHKRTVAVFTIQRDGTITDSEIIESSGVESLDKAALAALAKASPLPPLPEGAPKSIRLRHRFEIRIRTQY